MPDTTGFGHTLAEGGRGCLAGLPLVEMPGGYSLIIWFMDDALHYYGRWRCRIGS